MDWEATFIGLRLLDPGWLCLMYDAASWAPAHASRPAWSPSATFLGERYERAAGAPVVVPRLAGYRLHRRGRRTGPVWDVFAESAPFMRALELVP